ncbi:MAG: tetratricopeptide repeat protein [Ferruginibacter sp.]
MNKTTIIFFLSLLLYCVAFAQPTHVITDIEKEYKTAREFIAKEEYAFAYPLLKELRLKYTANKKTDQPYINDDLLYFTALCELKLMQDIGREDALVFINTATNEPRMALMSFHLAHYYFLQNDHENAVRYFTNAGYENLSNEQIADAKFEKAYAYFNLKQFSEAKPLFNEIHQVPSHKYFLPSNYYYGFISYYDKDFPEALAAFKSVETVEEYKGVVPYYIAEIYYFRGQKDEALQYGEAVLARGTPLYYDKQLRLLIGQIYFERKEYDKALPLLEAYVNSSEKVSKEILYELSYCYYITGNTQQAIAGFKQLSNERDSMGQNSMYLLGDLYLKTGEKENARTAFQYSAFNSSNSLQQKVSRFNFAKLSYELGYRDAALREIKDYLKTYPNSEYETEAKEILVALLARTSDYTGALAVYQSLETPTAAMKKIYPGIIYGKAIEEVNDGEILKADVLFAKVIADANAGTTAAYANFWRGEIAYRQQRYDDAVRHLSLFLQSNVPAQGEANATAARYAAGYSKFQQEAYVQAAGYFEQVAKTVSAGSSALSMMHFCDAPMLIICKKITAEPRQCMTQP